jgi:glutaredoxin-related protein
MKLPHKAINIGNNANLMTRLAQETGSPTVPKIFVQGRFIGGFDQLSQAAQEGQIWHMLEQPMV